MGEKEKEKEGEGGPNLTFIEHLRELRSRLWTGILLVGAAVVLAFIFRSRLMGFLVEPFLEAWSKVEGLPGKPSLNYASPIDPFLTDLKVALLAGLFAGMPFLLWQIWLFVAPGLYKRERRYTWPFLIFGYMFFMGGGAFCYWVILPMVFQFFFGYAIGMGGGLALNPVIMVKDYAGISLKLMMGFGIAFEMPLAVVILTLLGIADWKGLLRFSRYLVVLAFVVGAVLTPPDVISQVLLAGPLILLYFASVLVSFILRPGREKK